MKGIFGNVLEIDLSVNKTRERELDEKVYRNFLGGYGLGVWYIYKNLNKKIDPIGPENILGFMPGLFNGVNVPMAGRSMASAKSPLTGTWGDSNVGGFIGPELKRTGHDGIFINGVSRDPVYIYIENNVEILDASSLWGKSALETENDLRLKYPGSQVLSIGRPGENLSLISAIITDRGRALGRSGIGAVMGSKKLKAIVVKGSKNVEIFDKERLRDISNKMLERMNPAKNRAATWWHKYGTIGGNEQSHLSGDTPIKNWKGIGIIDFGVENARAISGEIVIKDNVRSYGCAQCPVACGAIIKKETRFGTIEGHRLEYEGGGMLGGLLLNNDLDSITYGFELANSYGYDVISLGEVLAFSMELFEKGIIKKNDLGFELNWGDGDAVIKMIEFLNRNEGIAKILNQGVMRASKFFNVDGDMTVHVHGQELPAHDPKFMPSLATTYVADPTPGRHTAGGIGFSEGGKIIPIFPVDFEFQKFEKYSYKGKGKAHAIISNQTQVQNSLGFCIFSDSFSPLPYAELINALTGWDMTNDELLRTGERIQNLRHLFNLREGIGPGEFSLPKRAQGIPPHVEGPLKGITLDVESLVKDYYQAMEWDTETGMPSRKKIQELGLEDFIK